MELQTISQVSKKYGISGRMLRYYEQVGLISSIRNDSNAYRFYDETALKQLNFIILLRKLRISVKQISDILSNQNAITIVEIFEKNISDLDEEITSLSAIKSILARFAEELRKKAGMQIQFDLLNDKSTISIIDSLSLSKNYINNVKENLSMDELNKANEKINKLADRDVRIVYLPPSDVAAYQYEGDGPESHVNQVIDAFVRESNLPSVKPDLRHYGFNSPNPTDDTGRHGYEMWVTIPDGFPVPEPLVKKHFEGGLYGAHTIPFGAFEEWGLLDHWLHNNSKYEYRGGGDYRNMFDFLEEHLNYVNRVYLPDPEAEDLQLDLLVPIKEKNMKKEQYNV